MLLRDIRRRVVGSILMNISPSNTFQTMPLNCVCIYNTFGNNSGINVLLRDIRKRVVGSVIMNISPSNILLTMLMNARFHPNCQAAFWLKILG